MLLQNKTQIKKIVILIKIVQDSKKEYKDQLLNPGRKKKEYQNPKGCYSWSDRNCWKNMCDYLEDRDSKLPSIVMV